MESCLSPVRRSFRRDKRKYLQKLGYNDKSEKTMQELLLGRNIPVLWETLNDKDAEYYYHALEKSIRIACNHKDGKTNKLNFPKIDDDQKNPYWRKL